MAPAAGSAALQEDNRSVNRRKHMIVRLNGTVKWKPDRGSGDTAALIILMGIYYPILIVISIIFCRILFDLGLRFDAAYRSHCKNLLVSK
ncbi:MAG: hypothetical protein ACOZF0_02230 [Thermodesulfobacteriota bacterium]